MPNAATLSNPDYPVPLTLLNQKKARRRRNGLLLALLFVSALTGILYSLQPAPPLLQPGGRLIVFGNPDYVPGSLVWVSPTQAQYLRGDKPTVFDLTTRRETLVRTIHRSLEEQKRVADLQTEENRRESAEEDFFRMLRILPPNQDLDNLNRRAREVGTDEIQHLLTDSSLRASALSWSGRQRALLAYEQRPTRRTWLQRWLFSSKTETTMDTLSFYISDRISGELRKQSEMIAPSQQHLQDGCELHWLPDNRHLSFLYGNTLWLIDTN